MTKNQNKRILSMFLLVSFTIGVISGGLYFEIYNSEIKINENQNSTPKSSVFDDVSATIVCYFENNFDDTHGHSSASVGTSFTTLTIEGSYSALIDAGTDYVRWSDTTDYTQGTIEFFFNPDTVSLDDNVVYYLYSGGDGIYPTSGIYLLNGTIHGYHYSANSQVTPRVNSTIVLEPDHRYHIAYSFGPTGTHLYVNGTEEDSTLDTRVMHPETLYYGVGKVFSLHGTTQFSAQGIYDMFRFSNIQRTSFPHVSEILGAFNDDDATIVSYFENNFDDTQGHSSTTNDMSFTSSAIEGSYSAVIDANPDYARWQDTSNYIQGTIECLFNPSSVSLDDDTIYYILSGGDLTYPQIGLYMTNGTIHAYHYSANDAHTPVVNSTTILEPDKLYHIAYSFGPTGTHLYINGIEEDSTSDTRILHSGIIYFGVGKVFSLHGTTQFSAQGIYDMFRFSNIQRTSFPDSLALLGEAPSAPILYSVDSPDEDGNIDLSWDTVLGANSYNIYRYFDSITEINGSLTLVNSTLETTTQDLGLPNGTYYYVVTASNSSGESLPSNCEYVEVAIPPLVEYVLDAPVLHSIISPNENGTYDVSWTSVASVEFYVLFRDTAIIVNTEGLTPIYIGSDVSYQEINMTEGMFYYGVVAMNSSGVSPLSNIESVVVSYSPENPPDDGIPGFPFETLVIFIGLTLIGLKQWMRKSKKNL